MRVRRKDHWDIAQKDVETDVQPQRNKLTANTVIVFGELIDTLEGFDKI